MFSKTSALCLLRYNHCITSRSLCRIFCTKSESIDDIYASSRQYFYYIDKDGKLYLEETNPKTFITAFKSVNFLDFFWRQIRDNKSNINCDYQWISHCGKELNFIKCQASIPIIFFDLVRKIDDKNYRSYQVILDEMEQNNDEFYLQFGGSLKIALNPKELICDIDTGRLYHKIPNNNKTVKCSNIAENNKTRLKSQRYGVIGSHLLLKMSNEYGLVKMNENENSIYNFEWNGKEFDIPAF